MLALGVAILAAGISGPAAWFLVPPAKFKAQARLQVAAHIPKVLYQTVETEALGGEDYKRYQTTQLTLVKSQLALNAALQDKEVSKYRMIRQQFDPIFWLQENLKVEFLSGSEVMEISLSGDNPEELAGIVNAVKKAYMEEVVNVDLKRRTEAARQAQEAQGAVRRNAEGAAGEPEENLPKRSGRMTAKPWRYGNSYAMEHLAYVRSDLDETSVAETKGASPAQDTGPSESQAETISAPSISEADINQWIDQHPTSSACSTSSLTTNSYYNSETASYSVDLAKRRLPTRCCGG